MRLVLILAAALATGALVAGCGSDDGAKTETIADPRGTISVGVGDTAELTLPSNPSTGYSWQVVARPAPAIARLASQRYEADESSDGRVGAGGQEVFAIEGVAKGATTLGLRYVGPDRRTVGERRTIPIEVE